MNPGTIHRSLNQPFFSCLAKVPTKSSNTPSIHQQAAPPLIQRKRLSTNSLSFALYLAPRDCRFSTGGFHRRNRSIAGSQHSLSNGDDCLSKASCIAWIRSLRMPMGQVQQPGQQEERFWWWIAYCRTLGRNFVGFWYRVVIILDEQKRAGTKRIMCLKMEWWERETTP